MNSVATNPMNTKTPGQIVIKTGISEPVLTLENTAEVAQHLEAANSAGSVALQFPKFTDGRAFSQAATLRRLGFTGDICATGDVLVDQLLQMQRCGFSSAQLRADQNAEHGKTLLAQFAGFYQGDARQARPRFAA